jgi:hypothetical protein
VRSAGEAVTSCISDDGEATRRASVSGLPFVPVTLLWPPDGPEIRHQRVPAETPTPSNVSLGAACECAGWDRARLLNRHNLTPFRRRPTWTAAVA